MKSKKVIVSALAVALGLAFAVGAGAQASVIKFNLSPDQNRIRADKNPKAIALLPKNGLATPGKLTVGTNLVVLPLGAYATDDKTIIGNEPDLAQLIADSLGLELNLVATAWEDWPLGLRSGKFDAVISNVTVTEERKELFDFATYRVDVLGFYVKSDSRIASIKEPKDVAGLKIIVGSGTNQEKILVAWDQENKKKGLKPVDFQYYDDDSASDLAIQSGRADATFGPNATAAYKAATNGQTKLVGIVNGGWPLTANIAVATKKGNGLAAAYTEALNGLIASGKYDQVLARWGLSSEKVSKSELNPPGLPKPKKS
jgi:ABC-type amino acid transport/signal transduction systems, periplasmic component/domain